MKEIIRKLSRRKLWMAIAGVASGIAMALGAEATEISTVAGAVTALVSVVTYIYVEGKVDAEGVKNAVVATQNAVNVIEGSEFE